MAVDFAETIDLSLAHELRTYYHIKPMKRHYKEICVYIFYDTKTIFLEHNNLFISLVHTLQNNQLILFLSFEFRICFSDLRTMPKKFFFFLEAALRDLTAHSYCSLTAAMSTHICHIDVKWYIVIYHNSCCWQIISSILGMDGI